MRRLAQMLREVDTAIAILDIEILRAFRRYQMTQYVFRELSGKTWSPRP
jgi:hypothetical protein